MRTFLGTTLVAALALGACTGDDPIAISGDTAASEARIAGANQGGRPLTATLSGSQEVPPRDTPATGSVTVTLNPGQGTVCYDMSVMNLIGTPVAVGGTAAHIHEAPAGQNGPIRIGLPIPLTRSFTTQNCVTGVDRELIREILRDPANYYVNLHTTQFRPGELRGQLSK